jgi:hypothetical protein
MSTKPGANGYPRVNLSRGGPQQLHYVHTLMLEAFVGPRPFAGANGRHLNDVKTDNRMENLAWGTPSENNYDRVRNGGHPAANKTHCKYGHEFTPQNTHRNPHGNRACKACKACRARKYKERKRRRLHGNILPGLLEQ